MTYMDVRPVTPNARAIVLLHGKNFCTATCQATIEALSQAGYRVVAVEEIGFCMSSKPAHYQFSFQQLADNTHALLASIGLSHVVVRWAMRRKSKRRTCSTMTCSTGSPGVERRVTAAACSG